MDLSTITPADFRTLFRRDFPYLNIYTAGVIYNKGTRVYYPSTGLFYDSLVNGTANTLPTVTANWSPVLDENGNSDDSVDNYIADDDIQRAFAECLMLFNPDFGNDDASTKMLFLYLSAHFLTIDARNAAAGIEGTGSYAVTSRKVGNVAETYGVPAAYLTGPLAAMTNTGYGIKYLQLIAPNLIGNVGIVGGWTQP